jgi:predicted RNase H-like HicB family nuclease
MFLEIIIQQRDDQFLAKSPLFPTCKGKGPTKKEALHVLKKAIAKEVSKQVQSTLTHLFDKEDAKQVIIDPNKPHKEQHYIYDIQNENALLTVFLKLKSLPEYSHLVPESTRATNERILEPMPDKIKESINTAISCIEDTVSKQIEETIILGYPLCMN